MEGLDSKLQSENPALIAQVFSDIYKSIRKNNKEKMYIYLKNKCMVSNTLVQETAKSTILMLIRSGTYNIKEVLADFVTIISTSSNILPLTKIIFSLMCLQIETGSRDIQMKYQLTQHPIIKILQYKCSFDIQLNIYKDIVNCYNNQSSMQLEEILNPLYLYCLCNPNFKQEMFFLRDNVWDHILQISHKNKFVIWKLLSWMQVEHGSVSEVTGILLNKALESQTQLPLNETEVDCFVALQILTCCNLIQEGKDCRLFLRTLNKFIVPSKYKYNNIYLGIISKVITKCSPLCLKEILELCNILIQNNCNIVNYLSVKSLLLLWMTTPSLLTDDSLIIAKNILKMENHIYNSNAHVLDSKETVIKSEYILFCNPLFFLYQQLEERTRNINDNHTSLLKLLMQLDKVSISFLYVFFPTLCGFLHLKTLSLDIKKVILNLICKCSLHYTNLLPVIFSNILYHLSNTKDSHFIFELLRTLPLTVYKKENIQRVIATIQTIGNQSTSLKCYARYLMYKIWDIDSNCYSNLETLLIQGNKSNGHNKFEDITSKASLIKMIAQKRPELHGRDLVPHISNILNNYRESTGAIACSLVIESIKYLCKADIIDITRTWYSLAPNFIDETRIPVIKSICSFLYEIPTFSYTESEDQLNDEVIKYLWKFVTENENQEVIKSALKALANFRLELICLNMPDEFLDEGNNQKDLTSLGQRAVSGKTWIKFLLKCKCRDAAVDFLIELVKHEINNYLKYLYQIKKQKEPDNYGGLPTNSIVKVLLQYIKKNLDKINNRTDDENKYLFIACMKILSKKYSKPLPPLNWCFLQELIHDPELKRFCIDIACHQIILSGSARRLVENYIAALTETKNVEDCLMIYENLKYIANSIQPVILKPFLEYSIQYAYTHFKTKTLLNKILDCLKSVLDDADVQNCNKNIIEDVLKELLIITDISTSSFDLLLNYIMSFSETGLELVTRYDMLKYEEKEFMKIAKIRCKIAYKGNGETPLKWLNDIFTIAFKNNIRLQLYIDDICECIIKNINHPSSPSWIMELFGQIQAQVADRCESEEVQYFCDILSLAIVYFSGMFILLPKNNCNSIKYFFPASLTFLLKEPTWAGNTSLVLEWLHYMSLAENISQEYKNIYIWSLCCLRHNEDFLKNGVWLKYMSCEIPIDTIKQ